MGTGMRSPGPDPRKRARGSAGALQGHERARDELKLGTGGAGRLGLIPTSTNPPWDTMKSAVQGQPFPSPPLWAGVFGHGILHSPSPAMRGGSGAGRDPPGPAPKQIMSWEEGGRERPEEPRGVWGRGQRQLGRAALGATVLPNLGLKNKKKESREGGEEGDANPRASGCPVGRSSRPKPRQGGMGRPRASRDRSGQWGSHPGPRASWPRSPGISPQQGLAGAAGGAPGHGSLPCQRPSAPGSRDQGRASPN